MISAQNRSKLPITGYHDSLGGQLLKSIEWCEVILLLTHGEDEIFVETYWPSPTGNGPLRLRFYAPKDTGADYVRQHFKCDPHRMLNFRVLPDQ